MTYIVKVGAGFLLAAGVIAVWNAAGPVVGMVAAVVGGYVAYHLVESLDKQREGKKDGVR